MTCSLFLSLLLVLQVLVLLLFLCVNDHLLLLLQVSNTQQDALTLSGWGLRAATETGGLDFVRLIPGSLLFVYLILPSTQ